MIAYALYWGMATAEAINFYPNVRSAISSLLAERRLLEYRRGIGTFVRGDLINYDLRSLVSFTEKAKAAGKKPTTRVLAFAKVVAKDVDSKVADALDQSNGGQLWEMKRLRLADKIPVILEHRYVTAEYCPKLTKSRVNGSMYEVFTDKYELKMSGADEIIRAVSITPKEAKLLGVLSKSPAIEVTAVGFLDDHRERHSRTRKAALDQITKRASRYKASH